MRGVHLLEVFILTGFTVLSIISHFQVIPISGSLVIAAERNPDGQTDGRTDRAKTYILQTVGRRHNYIPVHVYCILGKHTYG